jgi:ribonucleoside-diphosphate reductase alpha chain
VQQIDRIPAELKDIYKCAFEIDAKRLVDAGSRRQKWIDQAQSLNLYMAQPSGKKLDELYKHAWLSGLKTTYYLRTMGATHAEKTTIQDNRLNAVGNAGAGGGMAAKKAAPAAAKSSAAEPIILPMLEAGSGSAKVCSILDPDCEACQ